MLPFMQLELADSGGGCKLGQDLANVNITVTDVIQQAMAAEKAISKIFWFSAYSKQHSQLRDTHRCVSTVCRSVTVKQVRRQYFGFCKGSGTSCGSSGSTAQATQNAYQGWK